MAFMPIQVKALLVALIALMGVIGVWAYQNGVTGDPNASTSQPTAVDRAIPLAGSAALSQDEVGIELAEGYNAYLIVEGTTVREIGTELQPDGLRRNTAVRGVYYDPGPGRRVEALSTPEACAVAMIYLSTDGPNAAEPYRWCFTTT